jgi:hypothetical protein
MLSRACIKLQGQAALRAQVVPCQSFGKCGLRGDGAMPKHCGSITKQSTCLHVQGQAALSAQMVLPVDTPRMPATPRSAHSSTGLLAARTAAASTAASPSASPVRLPLHFLPLHARTPWLASACLRGGAACTAPQQLAMQNYSAGN